MKIAHVVDSLEFGGAEKLVVTLCRLQKEAGHDVAVHCLFHSGPLAADLERHGIPITVQQAASTLRKMPRLWKAFRGTRPDIVHCHNAMAAITAAAPARLAGAHVLVTRHGLVAPSPARRKTEQRFWIAAHFCDRVIAVCDATAVNLRAAPGSLPGKVVTIRNGAEPAPDGREIPSEGFTAVTVARLNREKDQATLLRAFAEALPKAPDLHLWIVGDGPLRGELETLAGSLQISSRVRFFGSQPDAGSWLKAADLFVLSSISEGLPVSLLEAFAAGLPAICTDVGGMTEVVRLAGSGDIVPPSDPSALAKALVSWAGRGAQLQERKDRARESYGRYFTMRKMADAHEELYRECLGPGKR